MGRLRGDGPGKPIIGHIVAAALRGGGFTVEWDGTSARRIALLGFDWKRRGPVG